MRNGDNWVKSVLHLISATEVKAADDLEEEVWDIWITSDLS